MSPGFDPRWAALAHAATAERQSAEAGPDVAILADLANVIACGLVYIGDQLGVELLNIASALTQSPEGPEADRWTPADVAEAAGEMPQAHATRRVKVVATSPRTVILELAGVQHQLFAGDTLAVPGLTVKQVPPPDVGRLVDALREVAQYDEHFGGAALVRAIARDALAEFERGDKDG